MFARDIMTTNVVTVKPRTSVAAIARLLIDRGISGVPVTDDKNNLVGIVSEADLVHRVKGDHELPRSWWVNKMTMDVIVNDGVVLLWGFVGSDEARKAVELAAENVAGVRRVENNLGVRHYPLSAA